MRQENDLGRDSVPGLVIRSAIPSMLAQFVSVLYSIVDRMFVGNIPGVGDLALAGVGVCGPVVTMVGAFAFLVGIGTGKASGPLCVCHTLEEVPEKFTKGDVLVVPYTNNDLLPYIRDAAAIICEEAGTDCHSATIGLTMDKPVIVGILNATRRMESGTMVTVDCLHGVIHARGEHH